MRAGDVCVVNARGVSLWSAASSDGRSWWGTNRGTVNAGDVVFIVEVQVSVAYVLSAAGAGWIRRYYLESRSEPCSCRERT